MTFGRSLLSKIVTDIKSIIIIIIIQIFIVKFASLRITVKPIDSSLCSDSKTNYLFFIRRWNKKVLTTKIKTRIKKLIKGGGLILRLAWQVETGAPHTLFFAFNVFFRYRVRVSNTTTVFRATRADEQLGTPTPVFRDRIFGFSF